MTSVDTRFPTERWHADVTTCLHAVRGRFDHRCPGCDGARAMPWEGISAETVRDALRTVAAGLMLAILSLVIPGLIFDFWGVTPW
ncbi:MAG: hypothetical protein QJR09_12050 [Micrococcus sp.]|nr:hypothetical protein [Micrococcus sp.]